jgi:hypothetical protein
MCINTYTHDVEHVVARVTTFMIDDDE